MSCCQWLTRLATRISYFVSLSLLCFLRSPQTPAFSSPLLRKPAATAGLRVLQWMHTHSEREREVHSSLFRGGCQGHQLELLWKLWGNRSMASASFLGEVKNSANQSVQSVAFGSNRAVLVRRHHPGLENHSPEQSQGTSTRMKLADRWVKCLHCLERKPGLGESGGSAHRASGPC